MSAFRGCQMPQNHKEQMSYTAYTLHTSLSHDTLFLNKSFFFFFSCTRLSLNHVRQTVSSYLLNVWSVETL